MILFEKRIFANLIKQRNLRGVHPVLSGWALNAMTSVLYKRKAKKDLRQTEEEKSQTQNRRPLKDKVKELSNVPQTKKWLKPPEVTRDK